MKTRKCCPHTRAQKQIQLSHSLRSETFAPCQKVQSILKYTDTQNRKHEVYRKKKNNFELVMM